MKSGSIVQTSAESDPEKQIVDVVIPVKDGGPMLIDVVDGWLAQELPPGWSMNLVIANDGSVDGVPAELERLFGSRIKVIHQQNSMGRSSARNTGASGGGGEYIAFFDADCIPMSARVLAQHIESLRECVDLTFGSIDVQGNDFWAAYLRRVARLREQRFKSGDKAALTAANFMVRRGIFDSVRGFDQRYRHYGFEDRDLIIRLLKAGARAKFVDNAGVFHGDALSLAAIAKKMRTAGRFTSVLFSETHPEVYRKMDFYRMDARLHGRVFQLFAQAITPFLDAFVVVGDWLLQRPLPFALKAGLVRAGSGMAYLIGTGEISTHNQVP